MQKMSDDLFKIKTKEKNEEEKSSTTGSKNPNDSNKSNAYHKINEMDLFEEINTKDEKKTQSRNNTSRANQRLDILDDAFAMDDLFGLDDGVDFPQSEVLDDRGDSIKSSFNPNTSEIIDRGEEVCFNPNISQKESTPSKSTSTSPKKSTPSKSTSTSKKDFKKDLENNAKTLLDSLYVNQRNSDNPHKTHESRKECSSLDHKSEASFSPGSSPKDYFNSNTSANTDKCKDVCFNSNTSTDTDKCKDVCFNSNTSTDIDKCNDVCFSQSDNLSQDHSIKKEKRDEKGKAPLYSSKDNTPLAKGYDIPKKEEQSKEEKFKEKFKERSKDKSEEKRHSPDVSMKTRASSIGDYIDKIKEKIATESPGEKLNSTKEENGDNVTIEDKIYTGLETGCNVALDMMEGAGENLAFRLKRGATSIFSSFQNKMLKKKFKRNDNIIQYGDFMFYEMEDELMLYRYIGVDTEIKIPSYVEGMPVSYLEKNFLRFNAIKSIGRGLSIDRIQDISMESIQDNLFNIKSVQLPSTLKILPAKVFSGCKRIDELVIPESVTLVQPNAFVGCRPTRIIFLGEAPKQLQDSNLAKVHIYCKQEHFDSFFKLMRNYDDYIANKTIKERYLRLRNKILNSKDTSKWERMRRATDISDESLIKGLHNVN